MTQDICYLGCSWVQHPVDSQELYLLVSCRLTGGTDCCGSPQNPTEQVPAQPLNRTQGTQPCSFWATLSSSDSPGKKLFLEQDFVGAYRNTAHTHTKSNSYNPSPEAEMPITRNRKRRMTVPLLLCTAQQEEGHKLAQHLYSTLPRIHRMIAKKIQSYASKSNHYTAAFYIGDYA